MKANKIATYGLLVALAFVFSYIESLIPIPVPIPGIKLGLANLVVLVGLYILGAKEAFVLSVLRIVLVGFTFGNPSTMLFSLGGGLLSWFVMALFKKTGWFGTVGVSILGGLFHNIGQILVAMFVIQTSALLYYLPFLLIAGAITGTLIGLLGGAMIVRIQKHIHT